ncbi:MAG: T9SS C-terminal target domain-containing protein [Stygiobacter sp.]|nr:MAG: T9SS C-terminal target domain-containing protein [Stygiobacter sp.]
MKIARILLKVCLIALVVCTPLISKTYYVATNGSDANSGTKEFPFASLIKAASTSIAGDTILIRGGVYQISSTISLGSSSKSGTATNYYHVFAYPGEKPVFDFSKQTSSDGIKVNGSYWYLKGIESMYSTHNGIAVNGSYNIIENCVVHDNKNSGMQFGNGASFNKIINCDSYYNYDPPSGGNADGFAPKLDVGTGNYFYGCRAWQNSDDGWDGYLRPADNVTTVIENCWSFMNGYLKDGNQIATGNGNGFKMGGGDSSNKDSLRHNVTIKNSLCFDNRVKGYDQNNDRGTMVILNCTGFRNGSYNFSIPGKFRATNTATVKNCISYLSPGVNFISAVSQSTNSWNSPLSVSNEDFISIDTTGVRGARKPDGSLPDLKFLHLAPTSKLIDAGVDVGLPFNGKSPDLGAYEYGLETSIIEDKSLPAQFVLEQNYPNPFNPETTISYKIAPLSPTVGGTSVHVTLKVYDLLGREVATLVDEFEQPGNYIVIFSVETCRSKSLHSGIYFYRLQSGSYSDSKKMVLLK